MARGYVLGARGNLGGFLHHQKFRQIAATFSTQSEVNKDEKIFPICTVYFLMTTRNRQWHPPVKM